MRLRSSVRPALVDEFPTRVLLDPHSHPLHRGDEADGVEPHDGVPQESVDESGVDPAVVVATDPDGAVARQMREARGMVLGAGDTRDDRVPILVFAGGVDSGLASTIAANFAVASAQLGYQVLLVDAAFGSPDQHRLFRMDNGPGLAELMGAGAHPVVGPTAVHRLSLMTAGNAGALPEGLIDRSNVAESLRHSARAFDLVVVDAGAGAPSTVAATAAGTRGVVLVVEKHRSAVATIQALADGLAAREIALLGSIVVR